MSANQSSPPTYPNRPHARLQAIASAGRGLALLVSKLLLLAVVPATLILLIGGVLYLNENRWLLKWLWIPLALGWLLSYLIYRIGKRSHTAFWQPEKEVDFHWTETDRTAWEKVRRFAASAPEIPVERFMSLDLYVESVQELANELARHYHPGTRDAVHSLTVPEILTAIELATADLRRFVEDFIPGSHLLTIRWLRRAAQVPTQWRRLRPLYDLASLLWNPWSVVYRRATQHGVVDPMARELESDALVTIYQAFLLSVGKYLIELNSHRLKAGPDAWRKWMESHEQDNGMGQRSENASPTTVSSNQPIELRIVVAGQVKAGKSSLINALVGGVEATVDVLPSTPTIARHTVSLPSAGEQLVLLDTVGYASQGPRKDHVAKTMQAVCQAAVVVLVLHACQPARQPDLEFLQAMDKWFQRNPRFVKPPILAVVTHIDQLPPPLEWEPPYDGWLGEQPQRVKEQNIRAVADDVRAMFHPHLAGVAPACTDVAGGRTYGVQQWVEPALLNLLPRGRTKVLVDALHADLEKGRLAKTVTQLWNASKLLVKAGFSGPEAVLPQMPNHGPQSEK